MDHPVQEGGSCRRGAACTPLGGVRDSVSLSAQPNSLWDKGAPSTAEVAVLATLERSYWDNLVTRTGAMIMRRYFQKGHPHCPSAMPHTGFACLELKFLSRYNDVRAFKLWKDIQQKSLAEEALVVAHGEGARSQASVLVKALHRCAAGCGIWH
jgi:hypothetical protein